MMRMFGYGEPVRRPSEANLDGGGRDDASSDDDNHDYARHFLGIPTLKARRKWYGLLTSVNRNEALASLIFGTIIGQYFLLLVLAGALIIFGVLLWRYGAPQGLADYPTVSMDDGTLLDDRARISSAVWLSWGMFIDPGTQTGVPWDAGDREKTIAIVLSMLGFIFNLLFLGVVVENMRTLLDRAFARYSTIYASDHVVILGWTPKSLFLINELMGMFEDNGGYGTIVILGNRPKYSMLRTIELAFRRRQPKRPRGVSIRVWEGDPAEEDDLTRISINTARFVVCLGESEDPRIADAQVVETLLSLQSLDPNYQMQSSTTVIAELRTDDTRNVVMEIDTKSKTDILAVLSGDAIDAALVQCALFPPVGSALIQLISFLGQNFIFLSVVDEFVDHTINEIFGRFPDAVLCGVHTQGDESNPEDRDVMIAPPTDYKIKKTDRLLFIADEGSDLRAIKREKARAAQRPSIVNVGPSILSHIGPTTAASRLAEKTRLSTAPRQGAALQGATTAAASVVAEKKPWSAQRGKAQTVIIIGWRSAREMAALVRALARVLAENSHIYMLSAVDAEVRRQAIVEETASKNSNKLEGMIIKHVSGSPLSERVLKEELPLDKARVAIVVGDPTNIKANFTGADDEYSEGDSRLRDARVFAVTTLLRAERKSLHIVPVYSDILSFRLMARVNPPPPPPPPGQKRGISFRRRSSAFQAGNAGDEALPKEEVDRKPRENDLLLVGEPRTTVFHRNALETGLIAMQANDPALNFVFSTILGLDGTGSNRIFDVTFKKAFKEYLDLAPSNDERSPRTEDKCVASFAEIAQRLRECRGHVLIGYATRQLIVRINPEKKQEARLWTGSEYLIMLRKHGDTSRPELVDDPPEVYI